MPRLSDQYLILALQKAGMLHSRLTVSMNLRRVQTALHHVGRAPEVLASLRALKNATQVASAYIGLRPLQLPCTVEFRDGIRYRLEEYYDLETLWQINFHGSYPIEPSDQVILDAGANVGLFTCWAAQRNPKASIIAIEPFPRNLERLQEHVRENGFSSRVEVVGAALSATAGTARLSTSAEASQMFRLTSEKADNAVEVPTVTLVDIVKNRQIDWMKMDIEGSEYEVLLNTPEATFSRIRRISLEYHKPNPGTSADKKDVLTYLKSCGYTSIRDCAPGAEYGMVHFAR
jgi:FkbM family methyltransferase